MAPSFDDPEFRALLAKAGVAHRPGMAADLLQEITPLLKADGVDLDDLDGADIATINAAMERAIERYNLSLLTPVGADRRRSLGVLRAFTAAIADGDDARAQAIIERVPPEADGTSPSVSQVTGVSLGLIDDWYADGGALAALPRVPVPAWHRKQSRAAASDLLPLARKGRAFDAVDGLIRRHRGLSTLEGGALVVAASLIAVAEAAGEPLDGVAERMLDGAPAPQTEDTGAARTAGSAFVKPVPPATPVDLRDRHLLREFSRWLEESPEAASTMSEQFSQFEEILTAMRVLGLDLSTPDDFDEIVDVLFEASEGEEGPDGDAADDILFDQFDALHLYVHFHLDGHDAAAWAEAHTTIEDALDELGPVGPNPFEEALSAAQRIPVADRMAAYLALPIVNAVTDLLTWIGMSRPVTPAGSVRRADIADIARLIGIDAVGVARVADDIAADGPRRVLSMGELPELRAWWGALQISELIEVTATRVRPGAAAERWRSGQEPPFDDAEKVIGMFLNEIVNPDAAASRFEQITAADLLRELVLALSPEFAEDFVDEDTDGFMTAAVHGRMRGLAALGIVVENADGESFIVPEPLRGIVARGLVTSMVVMDALDDLDDSDDLDGEGGE